MELCKECYDGYSEVLKGNREAMIKYSDESRFPQASSNIRREVIGLAKRKMTSKTPAEIEQEKIEFEIQRQEFALLFYFWTDLR